MKRVLLSVLVVLCSADLARAEAPWKVGTATVKITPEKPMWMGGYASRTKPADGTLLDLWAKVLAVETADGGRAVLVSCDLCGICNPLADEIVGQIQSRCGLTRSRIMLTNSHTHSGPVLVGDTFDIYPMDAEQPALIAEYSAQLTRKIVEATAEACSRLQPAALQAGEGQVGFAVNRRNNKEKTLAEAFARGEKPKGPVDHSVPVLAARDTAGRLRAVAFGYACHNTTLGLQQWCGDYAGYAQAGVEKRFPTAVALFHMGCGADQNPLPRRTVELCQRYGGQLATAVERVVDRPMRPLAGRLRTAMTILDLPYGEQPTAAELKEIANKPGKVTYRHRWARSLLKQLESGKPFAKSYPFPVQAWKLGDQLWVVLGGESVVDYSLLLKKRYGSGTWVTSYANDVPCYIPSRRVWEEGGYEAGAFDVCGMPASRWCPDIETRILNCVAKLAAEVR
jgi:hypothetical protein